MDKKKRRLMYFMYYLSWALGIIAIGLLIFGIIRQLVG